jgi:HAD superfamily hydrolase (TIGR01459 family)
MIHFLMYGTVYMEFFHRKDRIITTRILYGLEEISHSYDAFIIDLWGVIHNGHQPYPHAIDTLKKLKDLNKTTLLLSNSPRRVQASIAHLESMGLSRTLYTHIYTSGEDTYTGLNYRSKKWLQKSAERLYHLGPDLHQSIYAPLPYEKTEHIEDADFMLVTGTPFPHLEDYTNILQAALQKNLMMICANPDHKVFHKGQMTLCCGAIADLYKGMGGTVHYHGKPCREIYHAAFNHIPGISSNRILAIGDSLATDIKGGLDAGIDTVLIMAGIHRHDLLEAKEMTEETAECLHHLTTAYNITPTYALTKLGW